MEEDSIDPKRNQIEEAKEDILNEKIKLNELFVSYEKKYSADRKVWWPIKLYYGGKNITPTQTHFIYLIKILHL